MRYVQFKVGVIFRSWTPELGLYLDVLNLLMNSYTWVPDLVVTSVNDGIHMPSSYHYKDKALDVRSKNFTDKNDKMHFADLLRLKLGPRYQVLFEAEGTPNEHFHIEPL